MPVREKLELQDFSKEQIEQLKEEICNQLRPEFLFCDRWYPAVPCFEQRTWKRRVKFFLLPFLMAKNGSPVPSLLPIRLAKANSRGMVTIREFLHENYRNVSEHPPTVFEHKPSEKGHAKRPQKEGAK